MKVTIYKHNYNSNSETLNHFLEMVYASQMNYLARYDLKKGISKDDISQAVKEAIEVMKMANMNINQHFIPVYTQINGFLFKDFKLSHQAFKLVLQNLPPKNMFVSKLQIRLIDLLENSEFERIVFKLLFFINFYVNNWRFIGVFCTKTYIGIFSKIYTKKKL